MAVGKNENAMLKRLRNEGHHTEVMSMMVMVVVIYSENIHTGDNSEDHDDDNNKCQHI